MTRAPLSPPLRQVAAARRLFSRELPLQTEDYGRGVVLRWIEQFRLKDHDTRRVRISPADSTRPYWTLDARNADDEGRTLFYVHGGGFVYYSAPLFVPLLCQWAVEHRMRVYVFEYPKAPEHDVASIFAMVQQTAGRVLEETQGTVAIAGDSVGGLLALYLASYAYPGRFSAMTLIYPVLALHADWPSYHAFASGYFLDAERMNWFLSLITPAAQQLKFNPFSLSATALPPCHVHLAGHDILRDEARAWAQQMSGQGAPVLATEHVELGHDFCLYAGRFEQAQRATDRICETLFQAHYPKNCS